MGVRRNELPFEGQFTQVPNAWLRDERLSRKARGLLAEIMSHRVGWHVSVEGLVKAGPEGRDAIKTGLAELRDLGYLRLAQMRVERGRFGEVEYELCDPATADGKSVNGGLSADGSSADGSSADGKSAGREQHREEQHDGEHDDGAGDLADGLLVELDPVMPKGTRAATTFPKEFRLSPEMRAWAVGRCPSVDVVEATREFAGYWREGEGKGKRKKNWGRAWMNRMKDLHERNVERGWKPAETRKVVRGGRVVA